MLSQETAFIRAFILLQLSKFFVPAFPVKDEGHVRKATDNESPTKDSNVAKGLKIQVINGTILLFR